MTLLNAGFIHHHHYGRQLTVQDFKTLIGILILMHIVVLISALIDIVKDSIDQGKFAPWNMEILFDFSMFSLMVGGISLIFDGLILLIWIGSLIGKML